MDLLSEIHETSGNSAIWKGLAFLPITLFTQHTQLKEEKLIKSQSFSGLGLYRVVAGVMGLLNCLRQI